MSALLTQIFGKFKSVLQNPACQACRQPMSSSRPERFCPTCLGQFNFREMFPLVQTAQAATYAATLFNPTVKRLIYGHKFYKQTQHEPLLVHLLIHYWETLLQQAPADLKADTQPSQLSHVLVVPVPSHQAHRNHLDNIARQFAEHFGYQFEPELLTWCRSVSPQHTITSKKRRQHNVQGGMSVQYQHNPKPLLKTKRVIVIDDIHTTGATMHEALQAFQRCPVYDGAVTGLAITYLALAFQRHLS